MKMRKLIQKVIHMREHRVAVLGYAMTEGSEIQYLTVMPKEGRRMLKEFKETGKISMQEDFARRVKIIEPVSVAMAYTSGWYIKIPKVIDYEED